MDMVGDDRDARLPGFEQLAGAADWRALDIGAGAWFEAPSHRAGAALVDRLPELAHGTASSIDVDLRASGVRVRIRPTGLAGLNRSDGALAAAISAAAHDLGLTADPAGLQDLRLIISTPDEAAVAPFWRTVLGYRQDDGALVDPLRRDPTLAIEQLAEPRPLRHRIHFDLGAPYAERFADLTRPGVVAADPDGNEICLPRSDARGIGTEPELADWWAIYSAMVCYPTGSSRQAADLARAAAEHADDTDQQILIDLRSDSVTIDSGKDRWEGADFGLDQGFAEFARRTQTSARHRGLTADPARLRFFQLAVDAVDIPSVQAFWRAALDYRDDPRSFVTDLYDPRRIGPVIWFQPMEADDQARRAQRNRIQVEVCLPRDHARSRIDRAVAAGGRITHDEPAARRTTVADPEGNEVRIRIPG